MRKLIVCLIFFVWSFPSVLLADGSVIVEAQGVAAMGDNLNRKQAETAAMADAKRKAAEAAATYVRSETTVKDYVTEKDLVEAFSQAMVKVLENLDSKWYTDPVAGMSYSITVKAEVTPYTRAMQQTAKAAKWLEDPRAPLSVSVWSGKDQYRAGDEMVIFLRGNKPFYARVVYQNAEGQITQILPNPFRKENYFEGGVTYSLPSGPDQYSLSVGQPYGKERVIVYASTQPLGEISVKDEGPVYSVADSPKAVSQKTRGITLKPKQVGQAAGAGEFFEASVEVETTP